MEFLVGMITSWIAIPVSVVIGVVGSALLIRFKNKFPKVVETIIDKVYWVE